MTSKWRERQEDKQALIEENAERRAKLSNKEQLKALDFRLGEGVGAKKERKRLAE